MLNGVPLSVVMETNVKSMLSLSTSRLLRCSSMIEGNGKLLKIPPRTRTKSDFMSPNRSISLIASPAERMAGVATTLTLTRYPFSPHRDEAM